MSRGESRDQDAVPLKGEACRILVIDDDDLVRSGLAADLRHAGYKVTATGDPREGLRLIASSPPDAVLLDILMHEIDGMEVLKELRATDPYLPVVMITGHGSMESVLGALRAGASDYIQKPAFGEDVVHHIQLAIRSEQGRRLLHQAESNAEKVASLQTLAGGVAHDLNNQLTVILSSTQELMNQIRRGDPGHADLKWIAYSSGVIGRLAERLLSYSGGGNFVIEVTDLCRVVPKMLERIRERAGSDPELAASLDVEVSAEPVWVNIDNRQFLLALDHLVTNALEALGTTSGRVLVRVSLRDVDAELAASLLPAASVPPGRYASIRIEDDGPGMEAETLDKIFDPFFSTKFTGRGMGLPSAQGIFRGHQGHLCVSGEPGPGTVVEGLLPLVDSQTSRATPVTTPTAPPSRIVLSSGSPPPAVPEAAPHILIIDDEPMIRRMAARALDKIGLRVSDAENGEEGIRIFQTDPDDIGLVLLDLSMPDLDGVAVLRSLREIDPEIKVLLVSGYHSSEVADRFTDHRPNGFLQKPFSMVELRERVSELVGA